MTSANSGEEKKSVVAFIPARSGSKRIKDKNILPVKGVPLIGYTILSAIQSEKFERILVATDSAEYAEIAKFYGAEVPSLRKKEISTDTSPDIDWVRWAVSSWDLEIYDAFCILRPTSPLRSAEHICKAWDKFCTKNNCDSIRGVTKSSIHPGKMWTLGKEIMHPLLPFELNETPWHSNQVANLPEVYFQNASIEICWIASMKKYGSISGELIMPYIMEGHSAIDVNDPVDLNFIEYLIDTEQVTALLPKLP